jgi:purine-cytosine permease-like protein
MPAAGTIVGDNWLAILAAAVAFYAVGFVIYGAVFSSLWMKLSGYNKDELKPHMWKMAISPIMPILAAIGLSIVFKLAGVTSLAAGIVLAVEIWFFLILSTRLYSFVYSPEKSGLLVMDAIHLLLGYLVAGSIIAAWP